jgi:hypothetical protein
VVLIGPIVVLARLLWPEETDAALSVAFANDGATPAVERIGDERYNGDDEERHLVRLRRPPARLESLRSWRPEGADIAYRGGAPGTVSVRCSSPIRS